MRVFDEFEFWESLSGHDRLDEMAPVFTDRAGHHFIPVIGISDEGAVWNDDVDGSGTVQPLIPLIQEFPGHMNWYMICRIAGNPAETMIEKITVVDEPSLAYRGPETLVHPVWQPFSEPGAFVRWSWKYNRTNFYSGTVDVDAGTYQ